jgi:hypothetical protein
MRIIGIAADRVMCRPIISRSHAEPSLFQAPLDLKLGAPGVPPHLEPMPRPEAASELRCYLGASSEALSNYGYMLSDWLSEQLSLIVLSPPAGTHSDHAPGVRCIKWAHSLRLCVASKRHWITVKFDHSAFAFVSVMTSSFL